MKKKTVPKKSKSCDRSSRVNIDTQNNPVGMLVYNLDDPYQREEFKHAQNGWKYHEKIETYYQDVFRPHIKYDQPIKIYNQDGDLIDYELTSNDYKILEYFIDRLSEHFYGEDGL